MFLRLRESHPAEDLGIWLGLSARGMQPSQERQQRMPGLLSNCITWEMAVSLSKVMLAYALPGYWGNFVDKQHFDKVE